MRSQEGVSVFLRLLRRRLIVREVMAEVLDRFSERHIERVGRPGKDDDFQIRLLLDRLAKFGRRPVVLVAD